jgi:hypothetical protein
MTQVIKSVSILYLAYAACSAVFAIGCATDPGDDSSETAVEQGSHGGTEIHPEDRCDPTTFNASGRVLCRVGFASDDGAAITLDQFNATLAAQKTVPAWEYGGGGINVSSGQSFTVDNKGGETHTFTVVKAFGGGRVAGLNTASGNTVVAPECVAGANAANVDIASGTGINVTTGAGGTMPSKGTFNVQCCIHPWMRIQVTIK